MSDQTFDALLERIEANTGYEDLGVLRGRVEGEPDLTDDERSDLLGRIVTYRGDLEEATNPYAMADVGDAEPPVAPEDEAPFGLGWDDTEDPDGDLEPAAAGE